MKNCAALSWEQYNRTMYASTLCKQMTRSALNILEKSLCLLQNCADEQKKPSNMNTKNGPTEDCISPMNIDMHIEEAETGLHGATNELVQKVRYLSCDVDDKERCENVLQGADFIDDSLRIANGKFAGYILDRDQLDKQRSRVESLVPTSMPYDEEVHTSNSHYERDVAKETARRMHATDGNFNMLLSGVL